MATELEAKAAMMCLRSEGRTICDRLYELGNRLKAEKRCMTADERKLYAKSAEALRQISAEMKALFVFKE